MEKKDLVKEVLNTYGCSTSKEIANLIYRNYNVQITPAQVAGVIRPMITHGEAASSKNDKNVTVYWPVKHKYVRN